MIDDLAPDSPAMIHVQLVCWHCGAIRELLTPEPPQSTFELAALAEEVGMKGFFDIDRFRLLVFCNDDHARQQMTKPGRFRLRPKRCA